MVAQGHKKLIYYVLFIIIKPVSRTSIAVSRKKLKYIFFSTCQLRSSQLENCDGML